MKKWLLFALLAIVHGFLGAQGVRGTVVDESGEPLPYASIYVAQSGSGTSTNADGVYNLPLGAGNYEITFQYLGYAAQTKTVVISGTWVVLNIELKPQSTLLNTVTVVAGSEDPAYTIMRKAIAKAQYHLLQTDSYSARVYTKGTGKVNKIPWAFRKMLEKDGIDTNRAFTSESVTEISFQRPNTFKERILAIRTSGENDQNASPNAYINTSFYLPYVVDAVSPLSPKAFRYYRFYYAGSFEDRGFTINKIKVEPRSPGENVFKGFIYIRDNYWNIHSLDLQTSLQGFKAHIEQIFAPIVQDIWMPVTQKYTFDGSFMGLDVSYNYLASLSQYQVVVNPDLSNELIVVDEKIDAVPEDVVEVDKNTQTTALKEADNKFTRKDLEKLVEAYEEEEDTSNVVSDYWQSTDSTARAKDSLFWQETRPIPLTEAEKNGYRIDDSVYVEAQNDSLKANENRFSVDDILFGHRFRLGEHATFNFRGLLPELRFNTVEGVNFDLAGNFNLRLDSNFYLGLAPNLRYGISSNTFYGKLATNFGVGRYPNRTVFNLSGGRYINQFNPDAISPFINSIWSLFFARNYMKLYEQSFVNVDVKRRIGHKYSINLGLEWADRGDLVNHTDFGFFRPGENWYTSNQPVFLEHSAAMPTSGKAFVANLAFTAKPNIKFRRVNGKKVPINGNEAEYALRFRKGFSDFLGSTIRFNHAELGYKDTYEIGVKATIDLEACAGTFFGDKNLMFMDFKHFNGGLTELAPANLTGTYRLLDYYLYSTSQSYVQLFSHISFRKLLLTRIPFIRLTGIKENFFMNYLKTEASPNYVEIGYTIDQVFRLGRIEFVQSFSDFQPAQFGVRIGISSLVSN